MKLKLLFLWILVFFTSINSYGFGLVDRGKLSPPNLESTFEVPQNINEEGLLVLKGKIIKKSTSDDIDLNIQYLNENNTWVTSWTRTFSAKSEINEDLEVSFELPPSSNKTHKIKVLFSSKSNINSIDINWDKIVSHYRKGNYSNSCKINEDQYTMLITPREKSSLVFDELGKITGIKDRVNSKHIFNKRETLFSILKPASIVSEGEIKSLHITNKGNLNDVLAQTPEINYNVANNRPIPYLYSYVDPVYIIAGKFSSKGFKIKFSQWPGDSQGPGYHNFTNPNKLESRYFNIYNTINQKLSEIIKDQEPVVLVFSKLTGFKVYKEDGSIIELTGYSNYDSTAAYFGYPPDRGGGARGPGSENFIVSHTDDISLYGYGAIRYKFVNGGKDKTIDEINSEINKFIGYTGVFANKSNCLSVEPNATPDYTDGLDPNILAAPNSYIFDINQAKSNNYGGLYIPVKKAYKVWSYASGFIQEVIPEGKQSVSVVWEDKENLVNSLSINGSGEDAKLKIGVNTTKGKGNALVALHVGPNGNDTDPIYWSWHIWVTDDPTKNTVTYTNTADSRMVNTFMDRNLGALNNDFRGYDWNKSSGLMYQWGRKDPFPPMRYTDGTLLRYYTKNGEINNNNFHISYVKLRPQNVIGKNLKYAIQNPIYFINTPEETGAWFADLENSVKIKGIENFDLWGDNNKGLIGIENFQKQIKSPYDPCPAGWRVPSFARSDSREPQHSPWGKKNARNTVHVLKENDNVYPNAKFYLRMGVDFKNGSDNFNLENYSLTGAFKRDKISGNIYYQDHSSESILWSSTFIGNGHSKSFRIINDPDQINENIKYSIFHSEEGAASSGAAIRCSRDEVTKLTFNTEYFQSNLRNYDQGLDNPNTYLLYNKKEISIPVNKAYAVYNQILTNQEWVPNGEQSSNVYWTTNTKLIKSVNVTGVAENAKIIVKLNDNEYGNAVVSLHIGSKGNSTDPVYWSWHIWVPKGNPEENTITYLADKTSSQSSFRVFNTKWGFPPMKTEFMDRPLGSLNTLNGNNSDSNDFGVHYQWGRKDPIPSFYTLERRSYPIFLGSYLDGKIQYKEITNDRQYTINFVQANLQNELSPNQMMLHTIQNPLNFVYSTNGVAADWLSNRANLEKERWGHASKKSIFDPCPEGWRVPDFGFNNNINSPWGQVENYRPSYDETGKLKPEEFISSNRLDHYGITYSGVKNVYIYKNPAYNLGNVPAHGYRYTYYNNSYGIGSVHDAWSSNTLWSATMVARYSGVSFAFNTTPRAHFVDNTVKLSEGRNVVCARDVPRFTEEYFRNLNNNTQARISNSSIDNKQNIVTEVEPNFYPNPIGNILKTDKDISEKIAIYSANTGEKVIEGKFVNKELNVSKLKPGIYVLTLANGKSYKLIKK